MNFCNVLCKLELTIYPSVTGYKGSLSFFYVYFVSCVVQIYYIPNEFFKNINKQKVVF